MTDDWNQNSLQMETQLRELTSGDGRFDDRAYTTESYREIDDAIADEYRYLLKNPRRRRVDAFTRDLKYAPRAFMFPSYQIREKTQEEIRIERRDEVLETYPFARLRPAKYIEYPDGRRIIRGDSFFVPFSLTMKGMEIRSLIQTAGSVLKPATFFSKPAWKTIDGSDVQGLRIWRSPLEDGPQGET